MTIMDRGCWERGCACYDDRVDKDGVDVEAEMLKQGWRQCAIGQSTTQYCSIAKQAYLDGVNSGIEAEREACVKVCEDFGKEWYCDDTTNEIIAVIQARSEK